METQEITPSSMKHILAGIQAGSSQERLAWKPPTVAELQKLLPQYEISSFIARGGMGAVYKAIQRALNRTVAIKILPMDAIPDGEAAFAARFKHEAKAMARLGHPNIVTVFEAGETADGLLYFVMEHVNGTDLAQLIAAEGRLEPERATPVIIAMCEALAFAHEEGIVHRDIKPSNVMIDKRGRVKVTDFGLAKTMNVDSESTLTGNTMALGTMDFIAPESLAPGTQVDQRADIYAVGVMLYQLLTGQLPRGCFEPPSVLNPRITPHFDQVVTRALQADRQKRYATALELKSALENLPPATSTLHATQASEPAATPPAPTTASTKTTARWLLPATLLPLLLAGGWGVHSSTQQWQATTAPPGPTSESTPRPQSHPMGVWIPVTLHSISPGAGDITLQPDSSLKVRHGFTLPGFFGKNIAVRARVRRREHVRFTGIQVRVEGPQRVALQLSPHKAWLDTATPATPPSTAILLEPKEGQQTPASLQLTVVGDHAYGQVGDTPIPPLKVSLLSAGTIGIWSQDAVFRNIQVMLLDGLPEAEALKLAGVQTDAIEAQTASLSPVSPDR